MAGLSRADRDYEHKLELMRAILEANLELRERVAAARTEAPPGAAGNGRPEPELQPAAAPEAAQRPRRRSAQKTGAKKKRRKAGGTRNGTRVSSKAKR